MIHEVIAEANPWWSDPKLVDKDPVIQHVLSCEHTLLYDPLPSGNFVVVGPRQVGKTTFFKLAIRELLRRGVPPSAILFFSCELLSDFRELVSIIRNYSQARYLFFDEITFVNGWERAIKYSIDQGLTTGRSLYLSGSTTAFLRRETFPGRPIRFTEMLPLDFRRFTLLFGSPELRNTLFSAQHYTDLLSIWSELEKLFRQYLRCGGFPPAMYEHMEGGGIRPQTYHDLFRWIMGDVMKLGYSEEFARAILLGILLRYCQRTSLRALCEQLPIGSHRTLARYLEMLSEIFVVRQLYQQHRGLPAFRKERKLLLLDPFLVHVVERCIAEAPLVNEASLVEGVVTEHVLRAYTRAFFVRTARGEIDLYIPDTKTAIEIKWQERVTHRDFPLPQVFRNRILLTKSDFDLSRPTPLIPVFFFLAMLRIPTTVPYREPLR